VAKTRVETHVETHAVVADRIVCRIPATRWTATPVVRLAS